MSHFSTLVIVERGTTRRIKKEVERLLNLYGDHNTDDPKWDWWQFGGRFSGSLDGTDFRANPKNYNTCTICKGTGTRTDFAMVTPPPKDLDQWYERIRQDLPKWYIYQVIGKGCNACYGTGHTLNWISPVEYRGDILPVSAIRKDFIPFAIISPDGKWYQRGEMGMWAIVTNESPEWESTAKTIIETYREGFVGVLVDCHT